MMYDLPGPHLNCWWIVMSWPASLLYQSPMRNSYGLYGLAISRKCVFATECALAIVGTNSHAAAPMINSRVFISTRFRSCKLCPAGYGLCFGRGTRASTNCGPDGHLAAFVRRA